MRLNHKLCLKFKLNCEKFLPNEPFGFSTCFITCFKSSSAFFVHDHDSYDITCPDLKNNNCLSDPNFLDILQVYCKGQKITYCKILGYLKLVALEFCYQR